MYATFGEIGKRIEEHQKELEEQYTRDPASVINQGRIKALEQRIDSLEKELSPDNMINQWKEILDENSRIR